MHSRRCVKWPRSPRSKLSDAVSINDAEGTTAATAAAVEESCDADAVERCDGDDVIVVVVERMSARS